MKLTHEIIQKNLDAFNLAKKQFPIIQKYIDGEVDISSLRSVRLDRFGSFHDFLKESNGQEVISKGITWRKLKPILIEGCTSERLKIYLRNRTENQFIEILKDQDKYDKLLNGRWKRRPTRRRSGIRSERIESFRDKKFMIINYIISKEIEMNDVSYLEGIKWYIGDTLSVENTLLREMEITEKLMIGIANVIEESKIDFKKLNLQYITNFIDNKLKKLMNVEKGTSLKCIKDVISNFNPGYKYLKEGSYYTVESSQIRDGLLHVLVVTEQGRTEWHPFTNFEDVSYNRNSVLDSLLGE